MSDTFERSRSAALADCEALRDRLRAGLPQWAIADLDQAHLQAEHDAEVRHQRDAEAAAERQLQELPAPGPELRAFGDAVGRVAVDMLVAADPDRRARLRGLVLAILAEARAIEEAAA